MGVRKEREKTQSCQQPRIVGKRSNATPTGRFYAANVLTLTVLNCHEFYKSAEAALATERGLPIRCRVAKPWIGRNCVLLQDRYLSILQ